MYIWPYMHIYSHICIYAGHICIYGAWKNIYIGPIYMFAIFICVFLCKLHAAYIQMSAI